MRAHTGRRESLSAGFSLGLGFVSLHVKCEVVRSCKGPVTDLALEWFGSRVFPNMAGQFIGSSESPLATLKVALIRLLS